MDARRPLSPVAGTRPAFAAVTAFGLAVLIILAQTGRALGGPADPATIYLPMIGRANPAAPGPSSVELIDQALASGVISAETALTYKVYVEFHDGRLPSQFRGDDSRSSEDHAVMQSLAEEFPSLSRATQNLLAPFIMPPAYYGSWFDKYDVPEAGAAAVPGPGFLKGWWKAQGDAHVRVWWYDPADLTTADAVFQAMHDPVWTKLTTVMGREPKSDLGPHEFVDLNGDKQTWGDGGDGRLDIYVVPVSVDGGALTVAYPPGCKNRPSFILVTGRSAGGLSPELYAPAITHEFFHAIANGYELAEECAKYLWLDEASATWAIDYVWEKTNQYEHRYKDMFRAPEVGPREQHHREAYLFPFYLSHKYSQDASPVVRRIWDATEHYPSLEAIERSIPGGFAEQLPDFAVHLWNQPPFDDIAKWDDITEHAFGLPLTNIPASYARTDVTIPVALTGPTNAQYVMPAGVPYLANYFYHFTFPDGSSHLVTFFNGLTFKLLLKERSVGDMPVGETYALEEVTEDQAKGAKKGARVQALAKIGGKWQDVEDWTDKPYRTYCRDKASERIEELVIIFSNSVYEPSDYVVKPQGLDPMLWASNIGCWQWTGTANTINGSSNYPTLTTHSEVVWERVPAEDVPDDGLLFEPYLTFQPLSGQVDWTAAGTAFECTCSGADRYLLGRGEGVGGYLQLYPYSREGPYWRKAFGLGFYGGQFTAVCPEYTNHPVFMDFWFGLMLQEVSADGATLQFEGQDAEDYMKVDFQAQSQP